MIALRPDIIAHALKRANRLTQSPIQPISRRPAMPVAPNTVMATPASCLESPCEIPRMMMNEYMVTENMWHASTAMLYKHTRGSFRRDISNTDLKNTVIFWHLLSSLTSACEADGIFGTGLIIHAMGIPWINIAACMRRQPLSVYSSMRKRRRTGKVMAAMEAPRPAIPIATEVCFRK